VHKRCRNAFPLQGGNVLVAKSLFHALQRIPSLGRATFCCPWTRRNVRSTPKQQSKASLPSW